MAKTIFFLTILAFGLKTKAQNLLANGNLNDINVCTERRAQCAPEAWFYIPIYVQLPSLRADSNYCEIISMGGLAKNSSKTRTYFYTKTLCPLRAGEKYKFSVWVNTANNSFDHLDVWLGTDEPGKKEVSIYSLEPAFTITPEQEDSSIIHWKKYSIVYSAKGGEKFLLFGNLSTEGMNREKVESLSSKQTVLYAIDDLSLTAMSNAVKVCPEYNAVLKQVYDQNRRHPPGLIEDIRIDSSLIPKDTVIRKKEIIWVIVDTPPSLKKPVNDTLTIPDVLFIFNSSKLNPAFAKDLNDIIQKLKDKTFKGLEITGHTDNKGTPAYNLQLSKQRAITIKEYLLTKLKISAGIVSVKGMGETSPIASNQTAQGRQRNRRVEIVVQH